MSLLVAYFLLAIGVSFLCSVLEAVLLSITPAYVGATLTTHPRSGKVLMALKEKVDEPLAAILTLNTVAHTVGAAGVGAQAQVVFENIPFSIISGILTLLILVLSEIIPKTMGALFWRQLALPSTYLIKGLTVLLWPFVVISSKIRLLFGGAGEHAVSREEILAMADIGKGQGVLDESDAQMLRGILTFASTKAVDVMTPRTVVKSFQKEQTVADVLADPAAANYSRYPVLENYETLLGYVRRSEILLAAASDQHQKPLLELVQPALIFPEQIALKMALQRLLEEHEQLALIVDEFGSFRGVMTLEDILETLLGHEIMDESDTVQDMRAYAKEHFPNLAP